MEIGIKINENEPKVKLAMFQKMVFLHNALDNGWSIKKRNKTYIFTKKHEGKKEVFDEKYLSVFMKDNNNINNILS